MSGVVFAMGVLDYADAGWLVTIISEGQGGVIAEDAMAETPEEALWQVLAAAPSLRVPVAAVRTAVEGLVPTAGPARAFTLTTGRLGGRWFAKVETGEGPKYRLATVPEPALLDHALRLAFRSAADLGLDLAWLLRLLTPPALA